MTNRKKCTTLAAAETYGDKIVRRIAARMMPAGPWEEVPRG